MTVPTYNLNQERTKVRIDNIAELFFKLYWIWELKDKQKLSFVSSAEMLLHLVFWTLGNNLLTVNYYTHCRDLNKYKICNTTSWSSPL